MQLNLPLEGLPSDDDSLWEQLDEATRQALIQALALTIARVVAGQDALARKRNHE
jgi:hypothetical protein